MSRCPTKPQPRNARKATPMLGNSFGSTGSHLTAPTSEPRVGLSLPPRRTSPRPTGTYSRALTAAYQGGHRSSYPPKCSCPVGSCWRAPTSLPQGAQTAPLLRTYPRRPTGTRSPTPTEAPRGAHPSPPSSTSDGPIGSHSYEPTAQHGGVRSMQPPSKWLRSKVPQGRAIPSTLRAVRSLQPPGIGSGFLYPAEDLAFAGAPQRVSIRGQLRI
jgi:hypothetical protein